MHADVAALRDALDRIDELGCERTVCAGDLVDYGLAPEETLALLREREIPCIRGNHDRWAVGTDSSVERAERTLSRESIQYLKGLPVMLDLELEGVRVAIRHGTPASDMRGIYPHPRMEHETRAHLQEAGGDVLVVGHTHIPFRAEVAGDGVVVNPGSLLRTLSGMHSRSALLFDPLTRRLVTGPPETAGGTFGVLEVPSLRFTVHRANDGKEIPIPEIRSPLPQGGA